MMSNEELIIYAIICIAGIIMLAISNKLVTTPKPHTKADKFIAKMLNPFKSEFTLFEKVIASFFYFMIWSGTIDFIKGLILIIKSYLI